MKDAVEWAANTDMHRMTKADKSDELLYLNSKPCVILRSKSLSCILMRWRLSLKRIRHDAKMK
jgi:hypothetical protein